MGKKRAEAPDGVDPLPARYTGRVADLHPSRLSAWGWLVVGIAAAGTLTVIVLFPVLAFEAFGPETIRLWRWPVGLFTAGFACLAATLLYRTGDSLVRATGARMLKGPPRLPEVDVFA